MIAGKRVIINRENGGKDRFVVLVPEFFVVVLCVFGILVVVVVIVVVSGSLQSY